MRKKLLNFIFGNANYTGRYTIDEYYGQFYTPKTLKEVDRIINNRGKRFVTAQEEISFKQVAFDSTIRQTLRKFGKPLYRTKNGMQIPGHEIIFYRYDMGGYKVIAQLHFMNNTFFMGQYLFTDLESEKFTNIKAVLGQKYLADPSVKLGDIVIRDQRNNRIEVDDDSYSIIYYISGNPKYADILKQQVALKEEMNAKVEQAKLQTIYASL
ncbi:hypothetical protein [Adhaeribacter soli]|uniref:Uncharacterized protein n=1 Tax=Adhaeribacter soli TaxID=2607655 RepID=A0A5N1IKY8_9BACT|nr:hypothetical protein [Adhaeribacter soli]KAA9327354.1 hypothetical protein F0P94_15670 [Adhaeribacter soli]